MSATTRLMTADKLIRLPRGQFRYELVKGELIAMSPAGQEHGAVIMNLGVPLWQHVKSNDLGIVFGAETGFKLESDPDTVRAPDIAFVSRGRLEQAGGIAKGFGAGAPDLAAEVLSPGDAAAEVEKKVAEWFAGGARAVWVVSPERRTVSVYDSPAGAAVLSETDELDGGAVVPGFRCRVAEIFV